MSKFNKIGDLGTPERHARKELTVETIDGVKVSRVRNKLSYQILYKRKTINYEQFLAAEKIYETYLMSQPQHNCEYREPTQGGKRELHSDRLLHAQDSFKKALNKLEMHEKTLIIHVIVNDNPLNSKNMNAKKKKERRELIRHALNKLAKHYNYI